MYVLPKSNHIFQLVYLQQKKSVIRVKRNENQAQDPCRFNGNEAAVRPAVIHRDPLVQISPLVPQEEIYSNLEHV